MRNLLEELPITKTIYLIQLVGIFERVLARVLLLRWATDPICCAAQYEITARSELICPELY